MSPVINTLTWLVHLCNMTQSHLYYANLSQLVLEILGVMCDIALLHGYCSTVQGLLDWFEVDLGFPDLV